MTTPNAGELDRRRFFLASAGATLSLAGLAALTHAEDKDSGPFGGFAVGAQSYCFRKFNTEQALKRTHDLGLHYVEFFQAHAPLASSPDQIKALRKLCGDYEITPIAFGVQRFTKDHDANAKVFAFGKALGVKHFSADPDPDSFDSLDKLCEEYQISIAIHPHGPAGGGKLHRWYGSEVILPAVKDHHRLIGTCLDTGHLIRAEQLGKKLDPAAEVRAMGARNFGMHLKDHDNRKKTDVIYGQGVLDVPAVLSALKEVHFKGYVSIEYEANPDDPSPDMRACLEVLKRAIKDAA
jgi:sugar phosphate isomerase/epimerase